MSSRPLSSLVALALAGLPLVVTGCQSSEVERLESALAAERQQSDAARAVALAVQERLQAELDAQATETRSALAAADEVRAELTAAREEATAAEDAREELEGERDEVASIRVELEEWVDELLPLAEKQDPRLAKLREITEDIARQVEEYRGLKFEHPFRRRLILRDDVSKFMLRDIERDMPPEEMDKMVRVMTEFGLLRRDADVKALVESFMEGGVGAFYKPETGTFYLIEGKNDRGDRPIVFHELVHALEDQHFDLDEMLGRFENNSDATMGIKGLVEGSADRMQERYHADNPEDVAAMAAAQMTPEMMQRQVQMMQTVPPFLIASIGLYPYKNGSAFLDALDLPDNAALDEVFRNPPVSTEQVLHPERYGKDYPHSVTAPDIATVLGDEWEVLSDDNMGELFAGILLTTNMLDPTLTANMPVLLGLMDMKTQGVQFKGRIATAVDGWDGDRYTAAVRKEGEGVCVAWTTVWDSEADAAEFANAYAPVLGMRVAGKTRPLSDVSLPATFTRTGDGAVSGVQHEGKVVVVVLSAPADKIDAVFQAAWDVEITPDARDANDVR